MKRRRSTTSTEPISSSVLSYLPQDSINPFSYSQSTLSQFALAGLKETDEYPGRTVPDFPHRGLLCGTVTSDDDGSESGSEDPEGEEHDVRRRRNRHGQISNTSEFGSEFEALLNSIHLLLSRGDVNKAARAYSVLLQFRSHGKPVDIRRFNLWALGAEILMRSGEGLSSIQQLHAPERYSERETGTEAEEEHQEQRWGSAANMSKVKAYYETLIRQYPYDVKVPRAISAVHFWPALLGCEIYNVHEEHIAALSLLSKEAREWSDDTEIENIEDGAPRQYPGQMVKNRIRQREDEIRTRALTSMQEISKRASDLMQEQPYSSSIQLLELRANASLYIADLLIPLDIVTTSTRQHAEATRLQEHDLARQLLERILEKGGELDQASKAFLEDIQEQDEHKSVSSHSSSLPIR